MSTDRPISDLGEFLAPLFTTGEARLTDRPEPGALGDAEEVLRHAFEKHRLDVAGPPIEFDPAAAVPAALYTARACWFLVSREDPPEAVAELLKPLAEPAAPAAHLSIDLTLRYAVTIHRRAHAQNPVDVLAKRLAETFRRCPLTGVLSDVAEHPTAALTFAGHRGLELLYAERLAAHYRPAWLPAGGRGRELAELVFGQQGKNWPPEG